VGLDDYLSCNFEELQNLLQCIPPATLLPPHSWRSRLTTSINVRFDAPRSVIKTNKKLSGIARLWPAQRRARYESIHKAVQYNNSGAIQTATNINESDGFTMGPRKEGFPLFI